MSLGTSPGVHRDLRARAGAPTIFDVWQEEPVHVE